MNTTSRSEAQAHIAKIRQEKGLSDEIISIHNVTDLENALTTLSEQLYQSSTHFLLELIQNADDNSYDSDVQPSVHFAYSNGCLRVDCNEVGFSPGNVEALCRVGQSTKKGGDNATRYVGEKGIGFKSVFKAATIVWVSSGNYSFKFDKSKPLGMIAPIWDDFPVKVKSGFTSFYLQLSDDYNIPGLLDELRSLDSRLLIFLRRLRNITVSISEPLRKPWKSSFSRAEMGKDLIRLLENDKVCDYVVKYHQIPNMPQESKRPGVSCSEIILGFPITENNQPKRESQQAYAFLPIRDYGFEFLIQADFLLIASREDIDDSVQWNHTLRKELSTAFLDGMRDFNKGDLRYLWPRYLPLREPVQSFLKPFHDELLQKLALEPVLFPHSGDLASPKSLTYVPEKYTFNGAPMTISAQNSGRFLSSSYLEPDLKYLKVLGVSEMDDHAFFGEIQRLSNVRDKFKTKSDAWHSQLASIIMRLPPSYSWMIAGLNIVPLSDGTWVAAGGRQLLFPGNEDEFELPGGLELSVVHSGAAADPARRTLFKFLGVGDLEREPVVKHIQKLHVNSNYPNNVTSAALISQIKFLYSAGWKNPTYQRFWFTSESGQRVHGSKLYQDSSKPHSATKFFAAHRKKFRFIHKDYMVAAGENCESWVTWLEEKMEVATMPRLVQFTPERGFTMSEDFEFIIKNFPSSDILQLLRDNWAEYSRYFDPDRMLKWNKEEMNLKFDSTQFTECATDLRKKLESMLVTCTTGKKQRLGATFLPSRELFLLAQEGMPFVYVPDPDNAHWEVLKTLGVSVKVDVSFYVRCLERLQLEDSDDGIRVAKLLNTIQLRCDDEIEARVIKKSFENKNLIFIPALGKGKRHQWVTMSRCRWKGLPVESGKEPRDFRTFNSLKHIYIENKRLFCEVLGVQDATLKDFVEEAKCFAVGDSLAHITSVFHAMEKLLEDTPTDIVDFKEIARYKIFPVSKNWKLDSDRVSAMETSFSYSEWFIADTAPFRTIFAGVVPLLDIKVQDLPQMEETLRRIGLKRRKLSKLATSVPRTEGAVELNQELTEIFRSKVDFIIRLIPTTKSHRKRRGEVIKQLRNLQVYTADEVIQEWGVHYKGKLVKGPPGNGNVALTLTNDVLRVYLAAKAGIEIGQTPMELVDELFNFCGMLAHNPEHSEMCLHVALSESNPARISKVFADKGIPSLESLKFADEEDTKEDDDDDPFRWAAKYQGGSSTKWESFWKGEGSSSRTAKNFSFSPARSILEIPFGIASGLFARRRIQSDGTGATNAFLEKKGINDIKNKPQSPVPDNKTRVPNGLRKFQKSVYKSWLRIATCDEDIAFRGEFAVHKLLATTLGTSYDPRQYWTSKLRTRAHFPNYYPPSPSRSLDHPTFTFTDSTGSFTHLIADSYPSASSWVSEPPTYHLDVASTRGGLQSEFSFSAAQFERAREFSVMMQQMKGDEGEVPKDVYILVRVYDVNIDEFAQGNVAAVDGKDKGKGREGDEGGKKVLFLVDPWECYLKERLLLRHKERLTGSLAC